MNDLQEKAEEKSNLLLAADTTIISAVDSNKNLTTSHAVSTNGNSSVSSVEKCLYVALFMLVVAIRIPSILLQGRFWAEEGSIFFSNAWHMHWHQVLLISYGGYLNITANLAGILAKHWAPLENACYVTSIFGLIFQTFPVAVLCLSRDAWLQQRKTLVAAMAIIATLPLSQEIWLSSIGTQCHLNLCAALILIVGTTRGATRIFQHILLFLGPLSGPGAAFLVPLFLARAWFERSGDRLLQAITLGAAAVIQFLFFWHPQERVLGIDPTLLLDVFCVKHIVAPFLGYEKSSIICGPWRQLYLDGEIASVGGAILALAVIAALVFAAWRSDKSEPKWLLTAGLIMFALSNFGALGDRSTLLSLGANERYVFAPQILFELTVLFFACTAAGRLRKICFWVTTWLLVIAAQEYFFTPGYYSEGPSWSSEVRRWRQDANYQPRIWPIWPTDAWRVNLNK